MKVSVVIVTYNSKLRDIISTLETVLRQNFRDYEVIISDDGSKENYFDVIRRYFHLKSFNNYHLIENITNQGTVKNVLSGLSVARGEYVKIFGPGDGFYDNNSLRMYYECMKKNNSSLGFAYMQGYSREDSKIKKVFHGVPRDILVYLNDNEKGILKNLILYSDFVCGASMFAKTEVYKKYLLIIKDNVRYCEDLFQIIAALDHDRFCVFPEFAVWYEVGTGTSTNLKYSQLIYKDTLNLYDSVFTMYPDNKIVKKRKRITWIYKRWSNVYIKTFVRIFFNPEALVVVVKSMIQKKMRRDKINLQEGFLDKDAFNKDVDLFIKDLY